MLMVFKVNNNNNAPNSSSKESFTKLYVPPPKHNLNNTANSVGLSKYFDCKFKVCTFIIYYNYTYILVFKIIGILHI